MTKQNVSIIWVDFCLPIGQVASIVQFSECQQLIDKKKGNKQIDSVVPQCFLRSQYYFNILIHKCHCLAWHGMAQSWMQTNHCNSNDIFFDMNIVHGAYLWEPHSVHEFMTTFMGINHYLMFDI